MLLSALLLIFSSCAEQDELLTSNSKGKSVKVNFELPEVVMTPMTRSGDGATLRFVMEAWLYDSNDELYSTNVVRLEEKALTNSQSASFEFDLETQGKYRLLFWADYIDASSNMIDGEFEDNNYITKFSSDDVYKGLKAVKVNQANYLLNNDHRDAFFGSVDFEKNSFEVSIDNQILTRAVGKLVLREKSEICFEQSKSLSVSYKVPNTFNVETGSTVGASNLYTVSVIDQPVVGTLEAKDYTLFYDYIFAPKGDAGYTIQSLSLKGKNHKGDEYEKSGIPNLPIKQNRRTIVSGTNMLVAPAVEGSGVKVETTITDKWDDDLSLDTDPRDIPFDGEGSESDPYIIASAENLIELMSLVNSGAMVSRSDISFASAHFLLTAPITFSSSDKISIGTSENPFKGTFDGGFHSISSLNSTEAIATATGLFGVVDGATLRNIWITDVRNLSNSSHSAAICGLSRGVTTIENIYCGGVNIAGGTTASGAICAMVESGSLTIRSAKAAALNSTVTKTKSTEGGNVGGLVGHIASDAVVTIEDSYNEVKTTNTNSDNDVVGGICGKNEGSLTIRRCYVNANVSVVKNGQNATLDAVVGEGEATIIDVYYNSAQAKVSRTEALAFSSEVWPSWDTTTSSWSSVGEFSVEASIYPLLDIEVK